MNKTNDPGAEFDRRLTELQLQARPSHMGTNLKEIILYEKLLQLEARLKSIEHRFTDPVER